ncbi:MAG: D-inositol 3-phosphate glycosyltransferase, partial [Candidatus Daviesbacteria bacterium GW2011_GWF2_38_7]
MNILRIAVISYHTCPLSDEKNADFGGMNTYVLELSKALAEKGYIIDIFAKATDKNSPAVIEVRRANTKKIFITLPNQDEQNNQQIEGIIY